MNALTNRIVSLIVDIIGIMITNDSLHLVMFVKEPALISVADRITKCQNIDVFGVLHSGLGLKWARNWDHRLECC